MTKSEMRKIGEAAVAKFLAEGGRIEVCKPQKSPKIRTVLGSVSYHGRKKVSLGRA